jgi:hypothetical protein
LAIYEELTVRLKFLISYDLAVNPFSTVFGSAPLGIKKHFRGRKALASLAGGSRLLGAPVIMA